MLGQEIPLYEELLGLLHEEKRLLSRRSRDDLQELPKKIETLVFKAKGFENLRGEVILILKDSLGLADTQAQKINLTHKDTGTSRLFQQRDAKEASGGHRLLRRGQEQGYFDIRRS